MPCVLDLNVIWNAATGRSHISDPDPTPWTLLRGIENTCDKMIVSAELLDRYQARLQRLREREPAASLAVIVSRLLADWTVRGKLKMVETSGLPELDPRLSFSSEDLPFAHLALGYPATLATYDEHLIRIGETHKLPFLRPEDAVATLVPSSAALANHQSE